MIGLGMGVPLEKVYGVATFYAVRAVSEGRVQRLGVSGHGVLRQRLG